MTTAAQQDVLAALTDAERAEVERQYRTIAEGAVDLLPAGALETKLAQSVQTARPLRVKAGFDPTAPDLHLGHVVLVHKLRQFQELGHQVVFLIGDFTARVGDPTGRSEVRPPLSPEDVRANAQTYADQVFRILDRERTEIRFNTEWLNQLDPAKWLQLAAVMSVARMLEREDFAKRYREGRTIGVHEFFYPLLQGYDSVALAADVELGGTDQTFNLLVGRDVQRAFDQTEQAVLTMPLLEGIDGRRKMSKSFGNAIGVLEPPEEQFGKLMRIDDELMVRYYTLLSDRPVAELQAALADGTLHPMDAKKALAAELVARFHGATAAHTAQQHFEAVFSQRRAPEEMPVVRIALAEHSPVWLPRVLADAGLVGSTSEARRLLKQGAIRVDDQRLAPPAELATAGEYVVKVGKRRFLRLVLTPA